MNYDYKMSNQAFFDAWEAVGKPSNISDPSEMTTFFNALMKNTNGQYIVDHISSGCYDNVDSIVYDEPYFRIQWKCFETFRQKYLSEGLSEFEMLTWSCFGYATYDYIICDIRELIFLDYKGHLLVALLQNPIDANKYEKSIKAKRNKIISTDDSVIFEKTLEFYEGPEENIIKHICRLNSMPFFTLIMQSKETQLQSYTSKKVLACLMRNWVIIKLQEQIQKLCDSRYNDPESLASVGNACRRLFERYLKFFCVYTTIDGELSNSIVDQYGYVKMGQMEKLINKYIPSLVNKSLVNTLNDFSHDSPKIPNRDDIKVMIENSMKNIADLYSHLDDEVFWLKYNKDEDDIPSPITDFYSILDSEF